jgi:hypothetical protein
VRSINPADDTLDFQHLAIVNIASGVQRVLRRQRDLLLRRGSGCPNMPTRRSLSHEDGHWANQLYGTGNGPDGMGEATRDAWAMYVWTRRSSAPVLRPGNDHPHGTEHEPFCGDCCGGCYGEVHTDGEVWMGTAWKDPRAARRVERPARARCREHALPRRGWRATTSQIKSMIETQWLDARRHRRNVDNGTPHFADIDLGFRDQGFPDVVPAPGSFGPGHRRRGHRVQALPQS